MTKSGTWWAYISYFLYQCSDAIKQFTLYRNKYCKSKDQCISSVYHVREKIVKNLQKINSLMQSCGKGGPGFHQAGESPNNRLLSWLVHSTLDFEKTFMYYCDRKQQKAMPANKDNSCSCLYAQLTVRTHLINHNTVVRSMLSRWVGLKLEWGQRGGQP